ncbi:SIMPL domain-containing protein [Streptomyces tanashiensis]
MAHNARRFWLRSNRRNRPVGLRSGKVFGMTHPHPTPDAPQVTVRGEGRLEVEPELARIWLTVSARGTDRAETLADLTRRNARVLDLVKALGDAVEKLETGGFSISPELARKGRGERVHAYTGRVRVTAELTDFTALGELVNPARRPGDDERRRPVVGAAAGLPRRTRRRAGSRSRRRCSGPGPTRRRSAPRSPHSSNCRTRVSPSPRCRGARGSERRRWPTPAEAAGEAPPLDLEPQRQTVTAEVVARFTMRPPAL